MAEIVILDRDGKEHRVTGRVGVPVMETLRDLDFGVAAICQVTFTEDLSGLKVAIAPDE